MTFEEILQQFGIDGLLDELGLSGLPEEKKTAYIQQVARILKGNLQLRLAPLLTAEDMPKVESMTPDEFVDFMQTEKNVDFAMVAAEVGEEFRTEMVENLAYIKGALENNE